jgi:glycosyltransferase involved in cell wall biosynthesis
VGNALKSVLDQTFAEFEVVVCDNSDEAESEETAVAVAEFDDPRVRYVRTSGRLSMPDNWERAIEDARGEFVGILTDRSVFRRDALEVVYREIDQTGARVVTWFPDLYGRGSGGNEFKRRPCTLERYRHSSEMILDYFLHGNPKYSTKVIPKLMTSFCHRSILEAIRASPVGRCCPPVAPDFTSGFLMLAHCDWVLRLDECLYVSCGAGNGSDFRRGGELADRFRRDLGMEWHEIVDRMPSDACFSHALVLNDLMRIRDSAPERLPDIELDRTQYYLGCLNDFMKAWRHGARRDDDFAALVEALDGEPPEVKDVVQMTRLYSTAVAAAVAPVGVKKKTKINAVAKAAPPEFDTVFEAMAWDAANPRVPAATSLVDLKYSLDQMLEEQRARPPKRPRAADDTARTKVRRRQPDQSVAATVLEQPGARRGSRLRELLSRARALR